MNHSLTSGLRGRIAVFSLAVLAIASCKSAGGVRIEGLRPAADSRPAMIASVAIAPLDTILSRVDTLARTLELPFAGKDFVTMLAAQNGLPPDAIAQLDTSKAIGIVYLAPANKDLPPVRAMALTTRSGAATDAVIAALGTVGEKQGDLRQLRRSDGATMWIANRGTALVAASTKEGLAAAGALALEAQRPPAGDIVVSVYPAALAHWRGTDLRTALALLRNELIDQQIAAAEKQGAPSPGAAERMTIQATFEAFLDPLLDTDSGSLVVDIDPQRGPRVSLKVQPRAGSAFAQKLAAPSPYAVDPSLFAGADGSSVVGLWAVGPSDFWLNLYDAVLAAQVKGNVKGASEVRQHFQLLRPALLGGASGTLRAARAGMATDTVVSLKTAAKAAAVLDVMTALLSSRGFSEMMGDIYGRRAPAVRAKREGEVLRAEMAFPVDGRPGDPGTALKNMFGSATLVNLLTVARGRIIASSEPSAATRLAALTAGATKEPAAEVSRALEETKGRDGLFYIDLWGVLRPVLSTVNADPQVGRALGMLSALPGFSDLRLPLVMSYQGGQALTAELRVPMATLQSAVRLMRPFIGAGGGAPPGF